MKLPATWLEDIANSVPLNWTATHIIILIFMVIGVFINGGAIVFLFCRNSKTMFHRLLKILAFSDLVVDVTCGILWGIPFGSNYYSSAILPHLAPFLIPISHMAVMISNFATGIMGFERFVRFKFLCRFRYRSWITPRNFIAYIIFILVFPMVFYSPKFFELTKEEIRYNCSSMMRNSRLMHVVYIQLIHPELLLRNVSSNQTGLVSSSPRPMDLLSKDVLDMVLKCVSATLRQESIISFYRIKPTNLRKNLLYYRIYFVGANTIFGYIIPFVLLVILNLLIVRVLNEKPKRNEVVVTTSTTNGQIGRPSARLHFLGSKYPAMEVSAVKRNTITTVQATTMLSRPRRQFNRSTRHHRKSFRQAALRCGDETSGALDLSAFGLDPEQIDYIDTSSPEESDKLLSNRVNGNGIQTQNGNDDLHGWSPRRSCVRSNGRTNLEQSSHVTLLCDYEQIETCDVEVSTNNRSHESFDTPRLVRHGGFRKGTRVNRQANAQEARLTRISLSIICLYLICHVWKLIPTFYEAIYGDLDDPIPEWPAWLDIIKNVSHILVVFNSAVNFLLYLVL